MDNPSRRRPTSQIEIATDSSTSGFRVTDRDFSHSDHTKQLRGEDRYLHTALNALPHLVWLSDASGSEQWGNAAWQEFTGQRAAPDWLSYVHPSDYANVKQTWQQSLRSGQVFQAECRIQHRSGSHRWLLLEARFQRDDLDEAGRWYITGTDIHDRVLAQQELQRSAGMQKDMLDVSVDCIKILRTDGTLIHMNHSGCQALGVSPESGFGQMWLPLLPEEVRSKGQKALQQAIQGKNARFAGMSIINGQTPMHWDNILTPVKTASGEVSSILCVSRDITLQREAERRLRLVSEQDELTTLPNRRAFNKKLKRALSSYRKEHGHVGLMLMDLDHFKHVNDTLGHPAGDHLLRVLSRRLQQCMPNNGYVARLGGDEFAVVVTGVIESAALELVAQNVLAQMVAPITYAGKTINGGMSIGAAMYPRDAQDASSLMRCADTALNDLKAGGRGGVRMFDEEMLRAAEQAAAQMERARQIVRDNAIIPHYQPKVRLQDRSIVGFEALLRWQDAAGNIHSPFTVMAAFKDYELATRIGETMRTKVFADIVHWQKLGLPVQPISLNAAPVEFLRDDYAERLLDQLQAYGIEPRWIEIEITEHILGDRGSEYVIRALKLLKSSGVRIALDDFGTGQSSLTHLRDYPVDCLKIDYNFVRRIQQDPTILAIVKAMGQLGPNLSLDTVAEGVETEEQRCILLEAGYHIAQGYLFGKAIHPKEVEKMLVEGL